MSDELAASPERFRTLSGGPAKLLRALLISITVLGSLWALEVHNYFEIAFFKQQYLALFLALALSGGISRRESIAKSKRATTFPGTIGFSL